MRVKYLVEFPQSLGNAIVSHDPIFAITFPVGSSLADCLTDHLSCLESDFCVAIFSVSQST